MEKMNIGVVGCGNISSIYFEAGQKFENINIVACCDLNLERAKAQADKYNVPKATNDAAELMADPNIDIILNLTIPAVHAEIALKALEAGKHVYGEKPLAIELGDAKKILALAKEKGLRVGNAPDTFLGGGIQTSRKLIDDGWIGEPVAVTAFMMGHGHENWHPDPGFYYQKGGGPMFDMGPYYLTALTSLIGPVRRVTGSTQITFPERTITSKPKYGEKIQVNTPTHIAGVLDFYNGAVGTIITSFDVWHHNMPHIEIYGTEGTLRVPDPNTFGGPVYVRRQGAADWSEIPVTQDFTENSRGLGLSDMIYGIQTGRKHRASGELAYHVLEMMHGFHTASDSGQHVILERSCERPEAFPVGLNKNNISSLLG